MYGFYLKAAVAALMTWFVDMLQGDTVVLLIYFIISCADFITGVAFSIVTRRFRTWRLWLWVWKVSIQCAVAVIIALLFHMLARTSGLNIPVINALLFMYSIVDCTHVIEKLVVMGVPVHPAIPVLLDLLRKRALSNVTQLLHLRHERAVPEQEPEQEPEEGSRDGGAEHDPRDG